jgi:16S rRNA U1498 N3-methylase RsmE
MKIVAIKPAFYNGRRVRVGDALDIPQGTKGSWFAPVASEEAKAAKAKPAKQEPKALSELGSDKAKAFTDVLA